MQVVLRVWKMHQWMPKIFSHNFMFMVHGCLMFIPDWRVRWMMMYESCISLPCHAWDSAMAIWHEVSPRQKVCSWVFVGQLVLLSLKGWFKLNWTRKLFCAQAVSGTPTSPRGSRLRQQRHPMTSHDIWHRKQTHPGSHHRHFFGTKVPMTTRQVCEPTESTVSSHPIGRWRWRDGFGYPGFLKGDLLSKTKPSGRWGSVKCYQEFLGRDSDWWFILFILEFG